jgi:hypothetical protein
MSENRLEVIWGTRLLDEGYTSLPNLIIRNWAKVGVKPGEWALITAILSYKHDARDPYPSREQLAVDLDCHVKQIQRWIKSLKEKKLLRVGRRRNQTTKQWDNNVYSFKPLLDAVMQLVGEIPLPDTEDYDIEWEDGEKDKPGIQNVSTEPRTQNVSVEKEQIVSMGQGQIVSTKKKSIKKKNKKEIYIPPSSSSKPKRQKTDLPEWIVRQELIASKKESAVAMEPIDEGKQMEVLELLRALGEID